MSQPKITLHTYFRSSCSTRVRIALHLKNLEFTPVYVHLLKDEQFSAEYTAINPSATVPTIAFAYEDREDQFVLTQSFAILEYLDEKFPSPPLLPSSAEERARVRQICNIISCDIQPHTNLKMLKRVKAFAKAAGQDPDKVGTEWQKQVMTEGFTVLEGIIGKTRGKYSVGDTITLADICLVPAVDGAVRFGVEMEQFGAVRAVVGELQQVEAVRRGGWRVQGDTPAELREELPQTYC